MSRAGLTGHAAALLTIFFISTKVLLTGLRPVEVLFLRFALGFAALCLLYPRRLRLAGRRQELWFAAAGLCGVTLYFLLENIALTCTLASNVGVLVSVSPMLTALLSHFLLRRERLRPLFFAGLAVALAGVAMVSYNGAAVLELNPRGDLLALLAAAAWSAYSLLTRRLSAFGYPVVQTTRRTFAWGLLFLPVLPVLGFRPGLETLTGRFTCSTCSIWGWGPPPCALSPGALPWGGWGSQNQRLHLPGAGGDSGHLRAGAG